MKDSTDVRESDNKSIVVVDHTNLPAVTWARPLEWSADVCEVFEFGAYEFDSYHSKHFGTADGKEYVYLVLEKNEYAIIGAGTFADVDDITCARLGAALRAYYVQLAEVAS